MKRRSIRFKILFPAILLSIITTIFILLANRYYLKRTLVQHTQQIAQYKAAHIQSTINQLTKEAMLLSVYTAGLPNVQQAYQAYYRDTLNIEKSSQILEDFYAPVNSIFLNQLSELPKFHFHLPPATSFYRSWTEKRGDDLSKFRDLIFSTLLERKAISGIESGVAGISIRGITPIFSPDTQYYGSVEFIIPIEELMNNAKISPDEEFAIYLHEKYLAFDSDNQVNSTTSGLGKLKIVQKTSDHFVSDNIDEAKSLLAYRTELTTYLKGDYLYAMFPLTDYAKHRIGVGAFQLNISRNLKEIQNVRMVFLLIAIIFIVLSGLLLSFLMQKMIFQVSQVRDGILQLSKGKFIRPIKIKTNDELSDIIGSLNTLNHSLHQTVTFAEAIGKGNLQTEFDSVNADDELSATLLAMRNNLIVAEEEDERRKLQDEQNRWVADGLATINDILRQSADQDELIYQIISGLIKYLQATLGGIYLYNDDDSDDIHLQLIASYAYDRRKYITKKIIPGEGLIGTAMVEKQRIYITQLPDNYIKISSGLGQSNPECLLIIPLLNKDEILGVIEIASAKQLPEYQIEFVERSAGIIAATIASSKINSKTTKLLEEFRKQSEELGSQEEEVRQNLEELQATQEELQRKNHEFDERIHFYEQVLDTIQVPVSVTDNEMKWLFINKAFCDMYLISREHAVGYECKSLNLELCSNKKCPIALYHRNVKKKYYTIRGRHYKILISYLYGRGGEIVGQTEVLQDITDEVELKKKYDPQALMDTEE